MILKVYFIKDEELINRRKLKNYYYAIYGRPQAIQFLCVLCAFCGSNLPGLKFHFDSQITALRQLAYHSTERARRSLTSHPNPP